MIRALTAGVIGEMEYGYAAYAGAATTAETTAASSTVRRMGAQGSPSRGRSPTSARPVARHQCIPERRAHVAHLVAGAAADQQARAVQRLQVRGDTRGPEVVPARQHARRTRLVEISEELRARGPEEACQRGRRLERR